MLRIVSFWFFSVFSIVLGLTACSGSVTTQRVEASETLIVGTFARNGGEGIYRVPFFPDTGAFGKPELWVAAESPSYLTESRAGVTYAVLRSNGGEMAEGRIDQTGQLSWTNRVATEGASPCYVALSPNENFVVSANYMGSNITVFPLDAKGALTGSVKRFAHTGSGPNTGRQEAAHPHWAQWSPRNSGWLYVVDLGADAVFKYPWSEQNGVAGEVQTAYRSAPGAGPRHMAFHPSQPLAFLLNELDNTLTALREKDNGDLAAIMTLSTLPSDFTEHSQASHIQVNAAGTQVYIANRGHDSIARFAITSEGGLRFLDHTPTGGHWPRFFALFDTLGWLIVGNEKASDLHSFRVAEDGSLKASGFQQALPSPAYIALDKNR